jgi:CRISPR-associated protein Cas2
MTVIVLERVQINVRGELSRWMLEPKTGVFVGRVSALVRDKLWDLICEKTGKGAALLVYHTDTEQGFVIRTFRDTKRSLIDLDGLLLIQI